MARGGCFDRHDGGPRAHHVVRPISDGQPERLGLWLQRPTLALRQRRSVERYRRCDPGRLQLDHPAARVAGGRGRARQLRLHPARQHHRRRQRRRLEDHAELLARAGVLSHRHQWTHAGRPDHLRQLHAGSGRALRRQGPGVRALERGEPGSRGRHRQRRSLHLSAIARSGVQRRQVQRSECAGPARSAEPNDFQRARRVDRRRQLPSAAVRHQRWRGGWLLRRCVCPPERLLQPAGLHAGHSAVQPVWRLEHRR